MANKEGELKNLHKLEGDWNLKEQVWGTQCWIPVVPQCNTGHLGGYVVIKIVAS